MGYDINSIAKRLFAWNCNCLYYISGILQIYTVASYVAI